jgi:hypothetical protein
VFKTFGDVSRLAAEPVFFFQFFPDNFLPEIWFMYLS